MKFQPVFSTSNFGRVTIYVCYSSTLKRSTWGNRYIVKFEDTCQVQALWGALSSFHHAGSKELETQVVVVPTTYNKYIYNSIHCTIRTVGYPESHSKFNRTFPVSQLFESRHYFHGLMSLGLRLEPLRDPAEPSLITMPYWTNKNSVGKRDSLFSPWTSYS